MKTGRLLRSLCAVGLVTLLGAKCGGGYLANGEATADSSTYRAITYELTSDKYRRWLAAQDAMDSAGVEASVHLDTRRLTDADIERAIVELESDSTAMDALESTDFNARDYVLTTIALAQSWDAVNSADVRVAGLAQHNVDFLRTRAATDSTVRARPRALLIADDSDDDDRGERRGPKHGKGRAKGHGKKHR